MLSIAIHLMAYTPPAFSQNDRQAKVEAILPQIDAIYAQFAKDKKIPGYAYGIIVDGKLIYAGSGGFANLKEKIPATPQSMFRIASMTKNFTAMAIIKLRDEGKLRLDDPAHLYVPEIQPFTQDAPVITIRDLLTHSAGFPTDDPWADRKLEETVEELFALIQSGIVYSTCPETTFEYSNLGYALLGAIIEKVTGTSYSAYIEKEICKPIAQDGFSFEFTQVPKSRLALGYDQNGLEVELLHDGIYGAMGGLIASVESFSKYVALHMLAWPPRNDPESGPLKRSSLREMHLASKCKESLSAKWADGRSTTFADGYGFGLRSLRDSEGRLFVGHGGGLPGFGSNWYIMPDYGVGIVFFANQTYAPIYRLNLDVIEKIVTDAQLKPRELLPSKQLTVRQKELVDALPGWEKINSETFAPNFFLDCSLQSLREESKRLFAKMGQIRSIGPVVPKNQLRGFFVIEGENGNLQVNFSLTPTNPGRIQEVQFKEVAAEG